jgi:enoyl-CoA hydratase/carnithine racemase
MVEFTSIRFEKAGAVGAVFLNRPSELNPLDDRTVLELHRAVDLIDADREIEIIAIRGEGRAFSAGGDLKKALAMHRDATWMSSIGNNLRLLLERLERSDKLVIAIVGGLCVAGGIELILCCDLVLASDGARFSDGHLNFSLLPGAGGTQRLPRFVGVLRAKELLLTARTFDAAEAAEMGLVTWCVPAAQLEEKFAELTAALLQKSFSSRKAIKYLVNQGLSGSLAQGLQLEAAYVLHYESTHPDAHEGLSAFAEKRKPHFAPKAPADKTWVG